MDAATIEKKAKKNHQTWLKENDSFVQACRRDPYQNNQSRDFPRAVAWEKLPEYWKQHYRREAKYILLTRG